MDEQHEGPPIPGKDIAKSTFPEVHTSQPLDKVTSVPEGRLDTEMDMDTAQKILQLIVDTHENTITSVTDTIGGYSAEETRQAYRVVGKSIVDTYPSMPMPRFSEGDDPARPSLDETSDRVRTVKRTSQGDLALLFDKDEILLLYHDKDGMPQYQHQVTFGEPKPMDESYNSLRIGFDQRSGTFPNSTPDNPTLGGFRHMLRGARWVGINMLNWSEDGIIMPEQLDGKSLPPTTPPTSE